MANRYQDKSFPADDEFNRDTAPARNSDPLAELARLIGQTDPFTGTGRANATPPREIERSNFRPVQPDPEMEDTAPAGPPSWMQRARLGSAAAAPPSFDDTPPPAPRYTPPSARTPEPAPAYHQAPPFAADPYPEGPHAEDGARYDDALYGQLEPGAGLDSLPQDDIYREDSYGYQSGYEEENTDQVLKPRRGGLVTVAVVLLLGVVGTGAAFAYRTYVGSPRSGEPPIIKADTSPNKVVSPSSGDASGKPIQDRMAAGNGSEQLVSREEQPVDVKDATKAAAGGPRVVFPPLNQNSNPPSTASVSPAAKMPPTVTASNGTLAGEEPRKIKTFSVKGDPADAAATPAPKPAPRAVPAPAAAAPAPAGSNAPLSLSPQAAPAPAAPTRLASNNPAPAASGGGYVVQVSSQRNESDAQASYRALQGKFPSVLGSRAPLIKRADLGDKGVYYRAMVGPFGSPEEASQMCGSLKSAGGQCVVQRN